MKGDKVILVDENDYLQSVLFFRTNFTMKIVFQGDEGAEGIAGIGMKGESGNKGAKGEMGLDGIPGLTGPRVL